MSLQLVLASLYPPKKTELDWNSDLNWQPTVFNYEKLNEDSLLLVRRSCPRYHEELQRVFANELKSELEEYSPLFKELSNITGWKIESYDEAQSLFSTLKAEVSFVGFSLSRLNRDSLN